jgi:membrane protein implicated in regulation of membrane protease activity
MSDLKYLVNRRFQVNKDLNFNGDTWDSYNPVSEEARLKEGDIITLVEISGNELGIQVEGGRGYDIWKFNFDNLFQNGAISLISDEEFEISDIEIDSAIGKTFDVNREIYFDGFTWYPYNKKDLNPILRNGTISVEGIEGGEVVVELTQEEDGVMKVNNFEINVHNFLDLIQRGDISLTS